MTADQPTRIRYSDTCEFDDLDEPARSWPVVVETVQRHVVWVEADSPAEAARHITDDPTDYLKYDPENALGGDWSVREPDRWEVRDIYADGWYGDTLGQQHGPVRACTECGDVAHQVEREPDHRADCSQHEHSWSLDYIATRGEWKAFCYCSLRDGSSWPDKPRAGSSGDFRALTPALPREALVAHLRGKRARMHGGGFRQLREHEQAVVDALAEVRRA